MLCLVQLAAVTVNAAPPHMGKRGAPESRLTGVTTKPHATPEEQSRRFEALVDARSAAIVRKAQRVELTTLRPPVTAAAVSEEKAMESLRQLVLSRDAYALEPYTPKLCGDFEPDLAIRFLDGVDTFEVLLSFTCREVSTRRGARAAVLADMGTEQWLVIIAKQLLPADERLKAESVRVPNALLPKEVAAPPRDLRADFRETVDERTEAILREADGLELLRMKSEGVNEWRTQRAADVDENLAGFAVAFHRRLLDPELIELIRALVLDPAAYGAPHVMKLCGGFQPKAVFRFRKGTEFVDVLLCFNCQEVTVLRGGSTEPIDLATNMADAPRWLSMTRRAFPDDRLFQQTKVH